MADLRAVKPYWVGVIDDYGERLGRGREAAVDRAGAYRVAGFGKGGTFDRVALYKGELDYVTDSSCECVGSEDEASGSDSDGVDVARSG